ncbi:MAG: BatA domain-containing protein [Bacteroidia bacterium]
MQFVYPSFLWALFLIGIPILIHLFNFRRYKKVQFSNVSMLKKVQTQSKKSRQVKRWLILMTRILAVAAMVFAFAQPYFNSGVSAQKPALHAIYLDNSYSMSGLGEEGILLEQAKSKARTLVKAFGRNASFKLLTNEAMSQELSYEDILERIDDVELNRSVNDYNKILQNLAEEQKQSGNQFYAYLITDLQKQEELLAMDSLIKVQALRVKPLDVNNLSIDSVWLESAANMNDESLQFNVKISNHGNDVAESNLFLHLNGQQRAALSIEIGKTDTEIFQMDVGNLKQNRLSGYFNIQDPSLSYDNQYFISLNLKSELRILEISESESPFEKVFNDPYLQYQRFNPGSVDHSALFSNDLIIINALSSISSALANQLNEFMKAGGNVLLVPSDNLENSSSISQLLEVSNYLRLNKQEISLDPDALKSDFYKGVYAELPDYIVMPKWKKYYELSNKANSQKILFLKNAKAMLIEHHKGKGRLFQMASSLSPGVSNLAEHELFVISSLKILFSSHNNDDLAYDLDRNQGIHTDLSRISPPLVLDLEGQVHIVEHSSKRGLNRIWLNKEVTEEGVYVLANQQDMDTLALIALNQNRAESRTEQYSKTEIEEAWGTSVLWNDSSEGKIAQLAKSADGSKPLWKLFVLLCLIFLLLEILLLRFIKS